MLFYALIYEQTTRCYLLTLYFTFTWSCIGEHNQYGYRENTEEEKKHDCVHSIMKSWSSSNIVAAYYYKYMYKEPCMTSPQTGEA